MKFILVRELLAYILQKHLFCMLLHFSGQRQSHVEFFLSNLPCIRNILAKCLRCICQFVYVIACNNLMVSCSEFKCAEIHNHMFSEIDFWFVVGVCFFFSHQKRSLMSFFFF